MHTSIFQSSIYSSFPNRIGERENKDKAISSKRTEFYFNGIVEKRNRKPGLGVIRFFRKVCWSFNSGFLLKRFLNVTIASWRLGDSFFLIKSEQVGRELLTTRKETSIYFTIFIFIKISVATCRVGAWSHSSPGDVYLIALLFMLGASRSGGPWQLSASPHFSMFSCLPESRGRHHCHPLHHHPHLTPSTCFIFRWFILYWIWT